jgi:hypothetical protein
MRNYREHKGYTTRLIFDASKMRFLEMRVDSLMELSLEANDNVVELKRPYTDKPARRATAEKRRSVRA